MITYRIETSHDPTNSSSNRGDGEITVHFWGATFDEMVELRSAIDEAARQTKEKVNGHP